MNEKTLLVLASKANADKAINSLKGILLGMQADGHVNTNEVKELELWSITFDELIKRNPFNEFMSVIKETLCGNIPFNEAVEDLFWLCQKYESDNYYYNALTADLQTLQGICHGILADGVVNELEIHELNRWLNDNTHLQTYYPYDEIRSLVFSIIADGKLDEDEITVLKAYFSQFVKLNHKELAQQIANEVSDIQITGLCINNPEIEITGKTFCITGILRRGNRDKFHEEISRLGGIPTNLVNKKTDYLVVGDNGNPAWAFACYGRKVEKAMSLRKEGHTIVLIHEHDINRVLDNM